MNMTMKRVSIAYALALSCSLGAWAQEKIPAGNFAVVNSVPLSNGLLDQVLKNNAAQGVKESPELRNLVRSELIGRAALSQEAIKQGLDRQETIQLQLELLKQNFLAEALIANQMAKNPLDEAAVRAEYDRQVNSLKESKEYRIRHVVLADEATAKDVLTSIRKGEAFDKLAKEKSIDPSKTDGGDLGWLLLEQINPMIANVVVNLSKGTVAAAPIKVQNGWHVIRVDDVRAFTPPKYEDSKAQVRQGLQVKQRNEFVNKIISGSRIQAAE